MDSTPEAVIVYHGKNEFDAQMARDVLKSASIPILHMPSLSTGIFGVARTTRVSVPQEYADAAIETLLEEGFEARLEIKPKGLSEFRDSVRDTLPVERSRRLPADSQLLRVMLGILVIILALVGWKIMRTG